MHHQYFNPKLPPRTLSTNKKFERPSDLVQLRYHMALSLLLSNQRLPHLTWPLPNSHNLPIKDFIHSFRR
ncbi:hypothetical protein LINGRAHAP2_LOCUS5778 [Linum grandiflorum]